MTECNICNRVHFAKDIQKKFSWDIWKTSVAFYLDGVPEDFIGKLTQRLSLAKSSKEGSVGRLNGGNTLRERSN